MTTKEAIDLLEYEVEELVLKKKLSEEYARVSGAVHMQSWHKATGADYDRRIGALRAGIDALKSQTWKEAL